MINVGIIGDGGNRTAEAVRILLNHPDFELTRVVCPALDGEQVDHVYADLYGDTDLRFTADCNLEGLDALIAVTALPEHLPANLKVIDMTRCEQASWVYGLPELNRKAMVRGARHVTVPSAGASAAATALLPLAKACRLSRLTINLPKEEAAQAVRALQVLQPEIDYTATEAEDQSPAERVMTVTVTTHLPGLRMGDVRRLYDEFYGDHRFAFLIDDDMELRPSAVANTARCMMQATLDRDSETLTVRAVVDPHLRGGAGTAVHCLNLLFGLHELTGLTLKCSTIVDS